MNGIRSLVLEDRGVLAIAGEDRRGFLQGLISNDVERVGPDRAIYAAFLTAQGRYLHDFFVVEIGDALHLDCEASRIDDLRRRLSLYRLRAKVTLADVGERLAVVAFYGRDAAAGLGLPPEAGAAMPFAGGVAFVDPRHTAMGARAIVPRESLAGLSAGKFSPGDRSHYEQLRLSLGLPDGSRDLPVEKALLLENGFDEINGIDWKKGCYVGQEVTARMKYRTLVKRRLLPVRIAGPLPPEGTAVLLDGEEAGEMRSGADGLGLAVLRLDAVERAERESKPLTAGDAALTPIRLPSAGS